MLMDLLKDILKITILILVMVIPSIGLYLMIYKNEIYIKFNEKWKLGRTKLIILWVSVFIYSFLLNFTIYEPKVKLTNQINIFLKFLGALFISIMGLEIILMFYMFLIVVFVVVFMEKEERKLRKLKRLKNEK